MRRTLRQLRHGIVDHAHVWHAAFGGAAAARLLPHACRIHAGICARFTFRILVPLPRRRAAENLSLIEMFTQTRAGRFGGALHRGLRQIQARQFRQHFFRCFLETVGQQARQTYGPFRAGRQSFVREAHVLIPRKQAGAAALAIIVPAFQRHFAQQAERRFGPIAMKLRGSLAMRTIYTASAIAVFF